MLPSVAISVDGRAAARRVICLALLSLAGACAHVAPMSAPSPSARLSLNEPDRILRVSMPTADQKASVTLTGAPVELLARADGRRGDTLYTSAPFAVAVPEQAFELQIVTRRAPRGVAPVAWVEFTTVSAAGKVETVRARGTRLVLRRPAVGQPLEIDGVVSRSESRHQRAGDN